MLRKPYIALELVNEAVRLVGEGDFCMEFCPTCGCFLAPSKSKVGEKTVIVFACLKCGFTKQTSGETKPLRTGKIVHRKSKPAVTVTTEEDQKLQTMPTIKVQCPKCGDHF